MIIFLRYRAYWMQKMMHIKVRAQSNEVNSFCTKKPPKNLAGPVCSNILIVLAITADITNAVNALVPIILNIVKGLVMPR